MGFTFYIVGILLAALCFFLAFRSWYLKNRESIQHRMIEWLCYQNACNKGYINPGKYEHDRTALEYAIKHNKKQTWIVVD